MLPSKRHQSFPLRLSPVTRSQALALAKDYGVSFNHFINLAVAEKISRLEHDLFLTHKKVRSQTRSHFQAGAEASATRAFP